jgi:hypothetical protein
MSPKDSTALTPTPGGEVVTPDYREMLAKDEGLGVSKDPADKKISLIYVLQGGSPIVNKRSEGHIAGTEPGHFWLRGAKEPIRSGIEGFSCQPCGMDRVWNEWLPDRGGFVGAHPERPTGLILQERESGRALLVRKSAGTIIEDTRRFFILVDDQPYILPCTSTKHSFAREWQSYYDQLRHPDTGGIMPAFSHRYRLTTVPITKNQNSWFGLRFQDEGLVSKAEYLRGRELYEIVQRGAYQLETQIDSGDSV